MRGSRPRAFACIEHLKAVRGEARKTKEENNNRIGHDSNSTRDPEQPQQRWNCSNTQYAEKFEQQSEPVLKTRRPPALMYRAKRCRIRERAAAAVAARLAPRAAT